MALTKKRYREICQKFEEQRAEREAEALYEAKVMDATRNDPGIVHESGAALMAYLRNLPNE